MNYLKNLRILGCIEGVSTLVLFFIAMPLKYLAELPMAVTVAGSIHGILFLALVAALFFAIWKVPISIWVAFAGMVAAVLPFGPFVFDRWLKKS